MRFILKIRKHIFTVRITEQQQRLPRAVVESPSCQKFSGHGPGQLSLDMHAWAGALDQITSRGLFQPQPISDIFDSVFSVILQNDLLLIKKKDLMFRFSFISLYKYKEILTVHDKRSLLSTFIIVSVTTLAVI